MEFDDGIFYEIIKYCIKQTSFALVLTCKRFHSIVVYFTDLIDAHQKNIDDPDRFVEKLIKHNHVKLLTWYISQCSDKDVQNNIQGSLIGDILYNLKSLNVELIKILESRISLTEDDWLCLISASVRLNDYESFVCCCQHLLDLKELSLSLAKSCNLDEFRLRSSNWVLYCICFNRFEFLESVLGTEIYSHMNDSLWIHAICYRFWLTRYLPKDNSENRSYMLCVFEKYYSIYHKHLKARGDYDDYIEDDYIESIVSTNDIFLFEWIEPSISANAYLMVAEHIVCFQATNLYKILTKIDVHFDADISQNRLFFTDVTWFSYLLTHRNQFDINDQTIWKNVLFNGASVIVDMCKKHITEPLIEYDSIIESIEVAQVLIDMKTRCNFEWIKKPETLVWLLNNKIINYSSLTKHRIFYLALQDHSNKLIQYINHYGDLDKGMWFFINPYNNYTINGIIAKCYPTFLQKCLSICKQRPNIEPFIDDIVTFAVESNSIKIFDVLLKSGYDLAKNEKFNRLLDEYNTPGLQMWRKYKLLYQIS